MMDKYQQLGLAVDSRNSADLLKDWICKRQFSAGRVALASVLAFGMAGCGSDVPEPSDPKPITLTSIGDSLPKKTESLTAEPKNYQSAGASETKESSQETDRMFQTFEGSRYTSKYHIYAEGLDWGKPVGLLVYADGTGEYGLKNPDSDYLIGGEDGLASVAKRNNMVLLTPFSPNVGSEDADDSSWHDGDSPGYAKWAEELTTKIEAEYTIDKSRVAFGGYSSGAQLATEYWVPSGAAKRTMTGGVIVAISYGGSPKMEQATSDESFSQSIHMNWNVGSQDNSYTGSGDYGVEAGHKSYTADNYSTSLDIVKGLDHDRDDFGQVMEKQIKEHVAPV